MSWYRSGTIAVTNGSTAVVGTSTAFVANVAIGEGLLAPDGKVYEIAAVTSDTGLTLGSAYLGSNSSGQTYAIIPSQSYVRDLATQAATLVNSYQSVKDNAGSGKFGDGTVGSPGIQFTSDSDTGIRRTGANAIALVTGGADRVTVDANGTLAVTNSSSSNAMVITQTGTGNALVVEDSASTDSTPFVITNDGTVVAGTTAAVTGIKIATFNGNSGVGSYSADAFCYGTRFNKSRSATVGAYSILSSGDDIGDVLFYGDDGTQFVLAALIRVEVDGTPGTNDMPGRLVFSTTADGASIPTERMRIDSAGNVGIGGAPAAGNTLVSYKALTGGSGYCCGFNNVAQVNSDTTSEAVSFQSYINTAAASFTLTQLRHFKAHQSTIGAGSAVTNQKGFEADASLTGATNNYGFYSNIASGTNRFNFYAAGTADNYFAGSVGIGIVPNAGIKTLVGGSLTGATAAYVVGTNYTIQSDVTSSGTGFNSYANTQAASFALTTLRHFSADQGTIGATSSVTNQYGFITNATLVGATNNYGFYSNIAAASNRWNFYAAGSAPNYFNGSVQSDAQIHAHGATAIPAGGTAGAGFRLSSTANFGVFFGSGAPTLSAAKGSLYLRSDGSTTNDRMYVNTNGSTTWTAVTTAA